MATQLIGGLTGFGKKGNPAQTPFRCFTTSSVSRRHEPSLPALLDVHKTCGAPKKAISYQARSSKRQNTLPAGLDHPTLDFHRNSTAEDLFRRGTSPVCSGVEFFPPLCT